MEIGFVVLIGLGLLFGGFVIGLVTAAFLRRPQLIVVVSKSGKEVFTAFLDSMPKNQAQGNTPSEAIGALVQARQLEFGIDYVDHQWLEEKSDEQD